MMRMPAVIIRHHRDRDITNLRFSRELCFLQVGHADYVRAPTAIHIRLRLGAKLRTLHADVSAAQLGGYARSLASTANDFRHFAAYLLAKPRGVVQPVAADTAKLCLLPVGS